MITNQAIETCFYFCTCFPKIEKIDFNNEFENIHDLFLLLVLKNVTIIYVKNIW